MKARQWTGAQVKLLFVSTTVILTCHRLGGKNCCHFGAKDGVRVVLGRSDIAYSSSMIYIPSFMKVC
jgi:hypothetical protein